MEAGRIRVFSTRNPKISITVIQGHFATSHSHINYYIDMTSVKYNSSVAMEAARTLAEKYVDEPVDTIVCMDGCEIIGGYMAQELSKLNILSSNSQKSINIITPEFHSSNQMIFRDNVQHMITDKNIVLLIASATTGKTIGRSLECIKYYGGMVVGVSALFNASQTDYGVAIDSIFSDAEIEGYKTYSVQDCPHCKTNHKIDAIVNSFGYSKI